MRLNEILVPFNFTNNSYKLLLFTILICSILNLTGDIKAESFENSRNDVDTSMAKTVVRFMAILFHLKKYTFQIYHYWSLLTQYSYFSLNSSNLTDIQLRNIL